MATAKTIRAVLSAIDADPSLVARLRAERNTLAADLLIDPAKGREIINGSGNGQSYSVQVTMTATQRLELLQQVLHCYDNSITPSSWAPIVIS